MTVHFKDKRIDICEQYFGLLDLLHRWGHAHRWTQMDLHIMIGRYRCRRVGSSNNPLVGLTELLRAPSNGFLALSHILDYIHQLHHLGVHTEHLFSQGILILLELIHE